MRITSDQLIARFPALEVREFVRRYRLTEFSTEAAQHFLAVSPRVAASFIRKLIDLGFIEATGHSDRRRLFQITTSGHALANASAARPIHRRTADRVLREFLERLRLVNDAGEYAYRVGQAVLFGSMLTDIDRLGDVDVAIRLEPKLSDEYSHDDLCKARRKFAEARGRTFYGVFDWAMWPTHEVLLQLKARSSILSLHDLSELEKMPKVRYRVLFGDPQQIAAMIVNGEAA
jgi:predicted nucleotidyltransferase